MCIRDSSLSVAESCTSGLIASSLTSIAGSSKYFKGGIVAYNDKVKATLLGIDKELILQKSAVSEEVVSAMASKVAEKFKSNFAIATSGYAGPRSNTKNIPIGTVFIAVKTPENICIQKFLFSGNRKIIIEQAKNKAFEMLIGEIKKIK